MPDSKILNKDQEEDDYNSASDEDFDPTAGTLRADEEESSSTDDDVGEEASASMKKQSSKSQSKSKSKPKAEDLDFDNSGDEAMIAKGKKRKRKTVREEDGVDYDDEEGGEGGLVKTRAQRKAEGQMEKPLVQAGTSSVDINALWAQMSAGGEGRKQSGGEESKKLESDEDRVSNSLDVGRTMTDGLHTAGTGLRKVDGPAEETVVIKRTYEFAGQKMEEEKVVPASSAEAKLFREEEARKHLASMTQSRPANSGLRRPVKRKSMFSSGDTIGGGGPKGTKLNTLEKSKLDWAAHVDTEGMSEELEEARRAKGGYLGRMDFLDRMSAKREQGIQPEGDK